MTAQNNQCLPADNEMAECIPRVPTILLNKGERVLTPLKIRFGCCENTFRALKTFVARIGRNTVFRHFLRVVGLHVPKC
jgi:hypothetical protein